ncbi:type II toxin-antitoxin system Phd/YefM family antitoxin [Photorhabdus caribbeanensis]|uniref:type II toxin-antitoxin system Phd/YefM family antitoxin n=1 Tax=Photorhabdus caribbeanensis TaxID=1004165 RepID=UPI001FE6B155|nr:type II toxin-antitoxin system Phd/YefM family antitoxin [Photorhabdus caribbeanensis]
MESKKINYELISIMEAGERELTMDTINYSAFRTHFASPLDKVNDNHKPILITHQNGKPAIALRLEDFQAYEETAYLMASPKNAAHLNQAIAEVEAGRMIEKGLLKE